MVSMREDKKTFIRVGNNLAVDFINTQFSTHEKVVNQLECLQDLFQWAAEMEVPLESIDTNANIEDVWQLRSSIKTLVTANTDKQVLPEDALSVLNKHLRNAPLQQQLLVVNQDISLQPFDKKLSVDKLLGKVAYEAANLLTSPLSLHVKHCSNEKCILMFVDTSRSKKRRWCSMDICGNRAKASSFYHAHKE
ncbi:CGNR zinc finger domain-containing protein [Marinomonas flavescens]|nr:CGNR zinc finger domain-containing protein [Marinomonas flavescens]